MKLYYDGLCNDLSFFDGIVRRFLCNTNLKFNQDTSQFEYQTSKAIYHIELERVDKFDEEFYESVRENFFIGDSDELLYIPAFNNAQLSVGYTKGCKSKANQYVDIRMPKLNYSEFLIVILKLFAATFGDTDEELMTLIFDDMAALFQKRGEQAKITDKRTEVAAWQRVTEAVTTLKENSYAN